MHPSEELKLEESSLSYTVSQLNRKVKGLLELHFPLVWVEGEISNISRPSSGHWYFTLKDEQAQVSCAMFKRRSSHVKFVPKIGDHLKVRAHVSLYEGRGDYQLIVEHMEQAGFGLLQKRFEELKAKLLQQGLFDEAFKKPLPRQAKHLAVITSPTGAAIRDVLSVLQRRFPALPVTIIPSPVQGDEAPERLVDALIIADRSEQFDAILLCRGGGSIEDLWAFNSEGLARAIYDCHTPVVCAVGHEVDFTIADFVADTRAPTPSAAAELLSPDSRDISLALQQLGARLSQRMLDFLTRKSEALGHLHRRLKHPRDKLQQQSQRLDQLEIRLRQCQQRQLTHAQLTYTALHQRLSQCSPQKLIAKQKSRVLDLSKQLQQAFHHLREQRHQHFHSVIAQLHIVSPIATLQRGYSIAMDNNENVLRASDETKVGETVTLLLNRGKLVSRVLETQPDNGMPQVDDSDVTNT